MENTGLPSLKNDEIVKTASYPNIKSTFILFFSFLLNSFIVLIITGIVFGFSHKPIPIVKLLLYVLPILITVIQAVRKSNKQQGYPTRINFYKIQVWIVPLLIVAALALIIPLVQLSSLLPMPASVRKVFEATFTKDAFSIVTVVIVAPVMEEIFCRSIVLQGLLKNYNPHKAILISAIFFAAIHLNPWQAIPAFFSGLFLGWLYYKTQSVIPGMIVHSVINATATLMLFLPAPQRDFLNLLGMPYYIIALVVSTLFFVIICIVVQKKYLISGQLSKNLKG